MSAGLPLFILSTLATIILVVWLRCGAGRKIHRAWIAASLLVTLVVSWVTLLSYGAFHPVGSWGMAVGFVVSIVTFIVPMVYNKAQSNEHT